MIVRSGRKSEEVPPTSVKCCKNRTFPALVLNLKFRFMSLEFRCHIYCGTSNSLQMNTKRYASVAGLGILAALLFASPLLAPAFAWTSTLNTCVGSYSSSTYPSECTVNPSYTVGTTVSDTAKLYLTSDGSPYGTLYFAVASGSCANPTVLDISITGASPTVTGSGDTYYTASISTTGLSAGTYYWLVYYSGTGSKGYPRAPSSGYDCEQFTLVSAPPVSTPEFPFGMALLLAAAIPALVVLKRKFSLPSIPSL